MVLVPAKARKGQSGSRFAQEVMAVGKQWPVISGQWSVKPAGTIRVPLVLLATDHWTLTTSFSSPPAEP
jgi:hypothetical protein